MSMPLPAESRTVRYPGQGIILYCLSLLQKLNEYQGIPTHNRTNYVLTLPNNSPWGVSDRDHPSLMVPYGLAWSLDTD